MNFLAHCFLSGDSPKIIVGNFIGDAVKGHDYEGFENEIQKGIKLHRAIDDFTDHHPIVKTSKNRLAEKYGKYDSVITDILYDHFLAIHWSDYSQMELKKYAQYVYSTIQRHNAILPEKINYMLPYMIRQDWLSSYATKEGIKRTLIGMSRRASFESHMEEAFEDLDHHFKDLEKDFFLFFPQIIEFAKSYLSFNL